MMVISATRAKFTRFYILLLLLFVFVLVGCKPSETWQDNQGKKYSSSVFSGKWVIINYWASWCVNCKEETQSFNEFFQQKKNNVLIFGVNYDNLQGADLASAVKDFGIQYPVLLSSPAKLFGLENVDVVPVTFIINPQGKVVKKLLGPQTKEALQDEIK